MRRQWVYSTCVALALALAIYAAATTDTDKARRFLAQDVSSSNSTFDPLVMPIASDWTLPHRNQRTEQRPLNSLFEGHHHYLNNEEMETG